jgi:uncharacterized protein
MMAKPIGPICNLDCHYCFYLEKDKLYPETPDWAMSDEVLDAYVHSYTQSQSGNDVYFGWQGGEPTLLGVEFFRRAIALQKKYACGKSVHNALQTNGVLLDDEWGEFLSKNHFLVGISIDGPKELHDTYRTDKGGQSTFDQVLRGVKLLQRHKIEFNTLTTVNRTNSQHPLEVYRFLKEIGSRFMQFIPIVERQSQQVSSDGLVLLHPEAEGKATLTPWSVDASAFGEFLCAIFDDWMRHDVGRYFVQDFDVALENWMGMQASVCAFSERCGATLVMEHTGDVYSCDHFVYPEHKLGNVLCDSFAAMVGSRGQQRFGDDKLSKLPAQCVACSVRFACHGGCPKHRFLSAGDSEANKLSYLCVGLKKFFIHIKPYMEFIANELRAGRSPGNVMRLVALQDMRVIQRPPAGRNDPCPCGSGKKAKRCCYA